MECNCCINLFRDLLQKLLIGCTIILYVHCAPNKRDADSAVRWSKESFPDPQDVNSNCGINSNGTKSYICDPSNILTQEQCKSEFVKYINIRILWYKQLGISTGFPHCGFPE